MLDTYISRILSSPKQSLTQEESYRATLALLAETATPTQIARYLTALHEKGETTEEILGVIQALQENMVQIPIKHSTLDIVGTGGDGANSINISTAAAILAASSGVPVIKHGNRAISSQSGAADVLEAFGIDIAMPVTKLVDCFNSLSIAFCFAPKFHPALLKLRDIRRQIGTPTIFNMVGPFLNPAHAQHYVLGVFSPALLPSFADILSALKVKKSVVVHSDGLDELTCSGVTQVIEINNGQQKAYTIDPIKLGFQPCQKEDLKGGDAIYNARILNETLKGKTGPVADTIILNAAMGIYLYGITTHLLAAVELARENLLAGKAAKLLNRWIAFSK